MTENPTNSHSAGEVNDILSSNVIAPASGIRILPVTTSTDPLARIADALERIAKHLDRLCESDHSVYKEALRISK